MTMHLCKGCGAPIRFVTTPAGRSMPVDARPNPRGNVAVHEAVDGTWYGRVLTNAADQLRRHEKLHMPHFATCPLARALRR